MLHNNIWSSAVSASSSATLLLYTRTRRHSVQCTNSTHAESIRRMNLARNRKDNRHYGHCRLPLTYPPHATHHLSRTRRYSNRTLLSTVCYNSSARRSRTWVNRVDTALVCRVPKSSVRATVLPLTMNKHTVEIPASSDSFAVGRTQDACD